MLKQPLRSDFIVRSVIGIAVLLLCGSVQAQDWAKKMVSEFSHDFGTVAKNEKSEHTFLITNPYNEDIRFRVRSSCTCTELALDKSVLKTGEQAKLVAKFNTRAFVGPKQATITITFEPPFAAEVQITVRGNIRGDVMFEPGRIDFGSVTKDSLKSNTNAKQVQITKFNNLNWRIVDIKSVYPHVGVSLAEPVRIGNQLRYDMNVRLKESAPPGFIESELLIIGEEFGHQTSIPLRFTAKIASALQISPEVLTYSASPGEVQQKKVVVKATREFRIRDVTCSNPSFSADADPEKSSKVHFITVSYSADQPPGRYDYEIEFVTDLSDRTAGKIKAVVEVVDPQQAED